MNIPKTHQVVMPYLMLKDAKGFASFMKNVFGAEQIFEKLRDDDKGIMHSEVNIGGSTIMFCEANETWQPQPANMFVYVDNADASYAKAISLHATSLMEPADQSYGRSCGVTDPFGNTWWITSV